MKHAVVPLADGFEELEAVAVIDILRRAGIRVTVAGLAGTTVTGSHDITLTCDALLTDCDPAGVDALILPGGPGTPLLAESDAVASLVRDVGGRGGIVAAICAAPAILDRLGVLDGVPATSHPAHAAEMTRCRYVEDPVVRAGNLITSRGAGTAVAFAAELVGALVGAEARRDVLERIVSHSED